MWLLSYWLFPVIASVVWIGMLAAMFGYWEATGRRKYPSMEPNQRIAYISDVGAFTLKPLFIAGCCVTSVALILSFLSERWLRHTGKLARNSGMVEKVVTILGIIAAVAGCAGLILLSIFDTNRHPRMHDYFLGLFILGQVLSAIFTCTEYQRLGIHYRQHRILRISFWMKLAFIIVEVCLAVAFGVLGRYEHYNTAAILEWTIALIFALYLLSFIIDLLPSVRTKNHTPQGWKQSAREQEMGMSNSDYGTPLTNDSAGPNQNGYYHTNVPMNQNVTNNHAYAPPSRNF